MLSRLLSQDFLKTVDPNSIPGGGTTFGFLHLRRNFLQQTGRLVIYFLTMKIQFVTRQLLAATLTVACLAGSSSIVQAQDQSAPPAAASALPSDVDPNGPLAQVIKLTQSGVEESVILAYINGSAAPFNLTPDQIIYLKDLGLPSDAVTAMIQRDTQLGTPAPQTVPTLSSVAPANPTQPEQPVAVTQNYFYDTLSPYGSWVNVDGYGLCWQPTVVTYNTGWQPYGDHGHWVNTDSGWYWLSDYSWGATAFHYGRWFRDSRRGWCWWPDTTWAPSWVTWRNTGANDYCGWAPLPPFSTYRPGAGFYYHGVAVAVDFNFGLSANAFCFVPTKNFCDPRPFKYRAPQAQVVNIYQRTTIINNYNVGGGGRNIINGGIPPSRISGYTRQPIPQVKIRESSAPVPRSSQLSRDTLIVNRPVIQQDNAASLNRGVKPPVVRQNQPARPTVNNTTIINNNYNNSPRPPQNPPANNNSPAPNRGVTPPNRPTVPVAPTQNSGTRYLSPRQQDFSTKVPDNSRSRTPSPSPKPVVPPHNQPTGGTAPPAKGGSTPPSNSNGNQNNKSGH